MLRDLDPRFAPHLWRGSNEEGVGGLEFRIQALWFNVKVLKLRGLILSLDFTLTTSGESGSKECCICTHVCVILCMGYA